MSATTHVPVHPWVRTHRAVLTIALLALALATTLALLLVQLTTGSTAPPAPGPASTGQQPTGQQPTGAAPTSLVPAPPQQEINEGCQVRRVGVPC